MKIATALSVLLSLLLIATEVLSPSPKTSAATLFISVLAELFLGGYLVFVVRTVRESKDGLGTWGYFWRANLTKWISILSAVVLSVAFSLHPDLPSVKFTTGLYLATLLLSHLVAWVLFSSNKKGQLIWIANTFSR